MCGIAGIHDLYGGPVEGRQVEAMCELIRHRGPDDSGLWVDRSVGLGHRRLSIIDLSPRGRNPMPNEDGSLRLVFNGEVYNHRELRAGLAWGGHVFGSETDTEVILHLYE